MDYAGVPDKVAYHPVGTAGHWCVEAGSAGRRSQQRPLDGKVVHVAGDIDAAVILHP
jgi:hypothetical protein